MRRVNIADPTFEYDSDDPEGFRSGMFRVGPHVGAEGTGTSVYELRPGQVICPYHYEWAEEEWLLVLQGRPTLRHPGGEDVLAPHDLVFFPLGPEGAHGVRNDTDETVRVLMFSTVRWPAVSVYPDSDKVGVYPAPDGVERLLVHRSSGVEYFAGEPGA
ncbi:MAG TPA: cupin domain-containing protein [Solirubrobacteraceae bacterium]